MKKTTRKLILYSLLLFTFFGCKKDTSPVGIPSNLRVISALSSGVTLTWDDNATNETNFTIERISRATNDGSYYVVGSVNPNVTTFIDTDVKIGIKYIYVVRALRGESSWGLSNEVICIPR